jgi:dihydroneopterin aldolase/2-amino-4-hydroxy-6-hydroxymethyldihydropteridine diphosphokinase
VVEAFIAVGSNIRPEANITAALVLLSDVVHVTGISTMYRTMPLQRPEQSPFINGVWRIATELEPRVLKFETLRGIERQLGRVRTEDAYAPRTMDLDIALYGDCVIEEDDLVVPDPDVVKRPFLAIPIVELAPEIHLPGSERPLAEHPVCRLSEGMTALHELTRRLKEVAGL